MKHTGGPQKPYQMFWAGAKVPLPHPLPTVFHHEGGPDSEYPYSFYSPPPFNFISLLPTDWHDRFSVLHETGHAFDALHMTKDDRIRAARIIGHPGLRWFWGNWNPLKHFKQPNMENFADWYAQCAMGENGPQHAKLRRLLYSIADR